MPETVTLSIDGRTVQAVPGTLVIDAARAVGIEIPAFCYYEGLSLQAACRMCLVEVERMPKLMAACTLTVAEGMVVRTETPQVAAARKSTLEFLLTNHPLDCPVCDKGGECELQDMVFRYGAGEGRFSENKVHVAEKRWSPVVHYDAPRCILCFRCVRVCREAMGVGALGIVNRGVVSEIAPNRGDHLWCEECGACIDACPVGALTSGVYRYKTRPWEMQHVGTICTHCADGCKTTLGVRNGRIIRANNRDRSGVNGEFLCVKGRFAFDFQDHPERLRTPLVGGKPASWAEAIRTVAAKFAEVRERGGRFGVVGSNHTTNEENFYLQKFARAVLGTANVDHHRTGEAPEAPGAATADLYHAPAVLVVGADLAREHPLLAYQVRANQRRHNARVYATEQYEELRERLASEASLVIVCGACDTRRVVEFGQSLGILVKYVFLLAYSNSRGALDMGLVPGEGGLPLAAMLEEPLDALWVVGANPYKNGASRRAGFLVAQDLFLTETAAAADVVLPAACAYEKTGTVTNVCGEVQCLKRALDFAGAKTDLEIMGMIAREMGADIGPADPRAMYAEIRREIPGYDIPQPVLGAVQVTRPARDGAGAAPVREGLFTSGTLGRYCRVLASLPEAQS